MVIWYFEVKKCPGANNILYVFTKAGPDFDKDQQVCLFGRDMSPDELFESIDKNNDGEVSFTVCGK